MGLRAAIFALSISLAGAAAGQTISGQLVPEQFRPVDQVVGDLDPLSQSMRQVSAGLRYDGEHTNLFEVFDFDAQPHRQPAYYQISPGYTARVPRMDYLVRKGERDYAYNQLARYDGEFVELVPADTVFELRPLNQLANDEPTDDEFEGLPPPNTINTRIDSTINTYIDGTINTQIDTFRGEHKGDQFLNTSRQPAR